MVLPAELIIGIGHLWIQKLMSRALALCWSKSKGLTLKTSGFESLYGGVTLSTQLIKPNNYYLSSPFVQWAFLKLSAMAFNAEKLFKHMMLNQLTPVAAVTGCDKHWSLFDVITFDQNWHYRSILKLCRGKRSFQSYPDQSDWLIGA